MAIITFMSDFGLADHYVAAVKASLLKTDPRQVIVDISHQIRPFDIANAAQVLKNVFHEFPTGTVHLAPIDSSRATAQLIAVELAGHYFVGFDSGLFSLLSKEQPTSAVILEAENETFPAKTSLAKAAVALATGARLESLGKRTDQILTFYERQLKVTKRQIAGHVVHVDVYGNLLTNILKSEFETIKRINGEGCRALIQVGRESFEKFHSYFTDVDPGECFIIFNSGDKLQIGINQGNASELLGLHLDSPVFIDFEN